MGQAAQPAAMPSRQRACVSQSGQAASWWDGAMDWLWGAANGAAGQRYRAAMNRVRQMARIRTMVRRIIRSAVGA
ncbi:MAG: hypothetical protein CML66_22925 [Rhodobacteraceae bacterium]|nr:hypothetical protein [Paracoccaceae bacterium]